MTGLRSYLFRQTDRDKLPRLPRTFTEVYDPRELDPDIELILMTGRARNPNEAATLMQRYHATTGPQLVEALPPPPAPDWRRRFKAWIRQLEGSYQSDPHRREFLSNVPQMAHED